MHGRFSKGWRDDVTNRKAQTSSPLASFESKLIFFRNTFCVHRSLHPEQKSIIFYRGHQPNKGDKSHSNKSLFTIEY